MQTSQVMQMSRGGRLRTNLSSADEHVTDWYKAHETADLTGEQKLWLAALEEAVLNLTRTTSRVPHQNKRRLVAEDTRWLYSTRENVGSLRWICLMLDWPYEAVLKAIERKLL